MKLLCVNGNLTGYRIPGSNIYLNIPRTAMRISSINKEPPTINKKKRNTTEKQANGLNRYEQV